MRPNNESDARFGGTTNHTNRGESTMTESQLEVISYMLDHIVETQQRFMAESVQVVRTGVITEKYLDAAKAAEVVEEKQDEACTFARG